MLSISFIWPSLAVVGSILTGIKSVVASSPPIPLLLCLFIKSSTNWSLIFFTSSGVSAPLPTSRRVSKPFIDDVVLIAFIIPSSRICFIESVLIIGLELPPVNPFVPTNLVKCIHSSNGTYLLFILPNLNFKYNLSLYS